MVGVGTLEKAYPWSADVLPKVCYKRKAAFLNPPLKTPAKMRRFPTSPGVVLYDETFLRLPTSAT